MTLSSQAYQQLQELAQAIKTWLLLFDKHPEYHHSTPFLQKKKQLESLLKDLTKALQLSQNQLPTSPSNTLPLSLEWWSENNWKVYLNPARIYFYIKVPLTTANKADLHINTQLSFGGEKSSTIAYTQANKAWVDPTQQFWGFSCSFSYPPTFLSGEVTLSITTLYQGIQSDWTKSIYIPPISPTGIAIVDFLKALEIDEQLANKALLIQHEFKQGIDPLATKNELNLMERRVKKVSEQLLSIVKVYQDFKQHEILTDLIEQDDTDTIKATHFNRYWDLEFAPDAPAKDALNQLKTLGLPKRISLQLIQPLENILFQLTQQMEQIDLAIQQANNNDPITKVPSNTLVHLLAAEVHKISQLSAQFDALKTAYSYILDARERQASQLILKGKKAVSAITTELEYIQQAYQTYSQEILDLHAKIYKNNSGLLKDDSLKAAYEEIKIQNKAAGIEHLSLLELWVLGQENALHLHPFMFNSIQILLTEVNHFKATYQEIIQPIYQDFLKIDHSQFELSIQTTPIKRKQNFED